MKLFTHIQNVSKESNGSALFGVNPFSAEKEQIVTVKYTKQRFNLSVNCKVCNPKEKLIPADEALSNQIYNTFHVIQY